MFDQKLQKLQDALDYIIDFIIKIEPESIKKNIEKLREKNPGITNDALAQKIINRESIKNGIIGALTAIGGPLTLPIAISADLGLTWRVQAIMVYAIAHVYGHEFSKMDLKTDIYIILAGDAAKEALKRLGIEISKGVTKKIIQNYVTREMMTKIWFIVGRKIITKAGEKSTTNLLKILPIVAAPVGFAFDWVSTKIVGEAAIKYYSGYD